MTSSSTSTSTPAPQPPPLSGAARERLLREANHRTLFLILVFAGTQLFYGLVLYIRRRHRDQKVRFAPEPRSRLHKFLRLTKTGDGMFGLHDMGRWPNTLMSGFIFMFFTAPMLIVLALFVYGWLLALVEGWDLRDGPPFCFYAMSLIIGNFTPTVMVDSELGIFAMFLFAIYIFTVFNIILGLTGMLHVVAGSQTILPHSPIGYISVVLLIFAPVSVVAFCLLVAATCISSHMAVGFKDALYGTIDWLTTGGSLNLTVAAANPSLLLDPNVLMAKAYIALLTVSCSGVILGILGSHDACNDLMCFLEGATADSREDEQVPKDVSSHSAEEALEDLDKVDFDDVAKLLSLHSGAVEQLHRSSSGALDTGERSPPQRSPRSSSSSDVLSLDSLKSEIQTALAELRTLQMLNHAPPLFQQSSLPVDPTLDDALETGSKTEELCFELTVCDMDTGVIPSGMRSIEGDQAAAAGRFAPAREVTSAQREQFVLEASIRLMSEFNQLDAVQKIVEEEITRCQTRFEEVDEEMANLKDKFEGHKAELETILQSKLQRGPLGMHAGAWFAEVDDSDYMIDFVEPVD